MIIEKNMNIKLDIDSQIVAEYFKKCKNNPNEISKLVECMDDDTLARITSKYLMDIYAKSPERLKCYIEPFRNLFNEEKKTNTPDYKNLKVGTELYWNYGELDFVRAMCVFPGKETYNKLKAKCRIVEVTNDSYTLQVIEAPKNWLFGMMRFTVLKEQLSKEIGKIFTLI